MRSPLLSVIIPIHKAGGKLENLKEWFLANQEKNVEIILCVDGQDNQTEIEIDEILLSRPDLQPKIIRGNYGSPGYARNAGMELAMGRWIAFWDCDDFPHLDKILQSINRADILKKDCVIGGFEVKKLHSSKPRQLKLLSANYLNEICKNPGLWRFVFLRASIGELCFTSHHMAEDQIFISQYNLMTRKIYVSKSIFYTYVKGYQNQLTSQIKAVSSISDATKYLIKVSHQFEYHNKIFSKKLILRQILTGMRRGDIKSKLLSLSLILRHPGLFTALFSGRKLHKTLNLFLTGGLGNQLFQLSAALYLAENRSIVINTNFGKPRKNSSNMVELETLDLENIWFEHKSSPLSSIVSRALGFNLRLGIPKNKLDKVSLIKLMSVKITEIILSIVYAKRMKLHVAQGVGYFNVEKNNERNIFWIGYFQSYKWVNESSIKDILSTYQYSNPIIRSLKELVESENPLGVQIRLTDYLYNDNIGLLSKEYFDKAIERAFELGNYGKIWLFSDDLENAMEYIPSRYRKSIRPINFPEATSTTNLELLKLCRGYVIANSTFGWWGAALSFTKNAIVVAPNPWFKTDESPDQITFPEWESVQAWD